eukprot:9287538-Pyramimonas_sp.AAC.1
MPVADPLAPAPPSPAAPGPAPAPPPALLFDLPRPEITAPSNRGVRAEAEHAPAAEPTNPSE